ncbi:MAG: helix-turn-helix domain-containing protein [Bacteroidetes bacterium]|nr:helix-turn-helix domain-containing protein [Bacteroidota bacterium]
MEHKIFVTTYKNSPIVIKALNSELRRTMLVLLSKESLNINDIAKRLGIPQSTCTTNIKLLEDARLIEVKHIPAKKGAQKICSVSCAEVVIPIFETFEAKDNKCIETEMPIGLYTDFSAEPPCGLLSEESVIGYYDDKSAFLNPNRAKAQLIWFRSGYLEYRFPLNIPPNKKVLSVSVIAEICSEFPGYNVNWPSDITLWINNCEIGTWTSPGDMGDKRGHLTPEWWSIRDTQYGFRKIWKTTNEGSFVDSMKSGYTTISDLQMYQKESFTVRIGLKADSPNQGGLNIFGSMFGNYENDILLRVDFE